MSSKIDPTKPEDGVPAIKADLRANLKAAKDEIEATMTPDLAELVALDPAADLVRVWAGAAGGYRKIRGGALAGGRLTAVESAALALTLGDPHDLRLLHLTAEAPVTLTLAAGASRDTQMVVDRKSAVAVAVQVQDGASYSLPGDGARRTEGFRLMGLVSLAVRANPDGRSARWLVAGRTDHGQVLDADLDGGGHHITNTVMPAADREETASFTLTLAHGRQRMVRCNSATAMVVTVPDDDRVAFADGTALHLVRWGAGSLAITAAPGVTLHKPSDRTTTVRAQYSVVSLWKQGPGSWLLHGDLA